MLQDGLRKAMDGIASIEEVVRVLGTDPRELAHTAQGRSSAAAAADGNAAAFRLLPAVPFRVVGTPEAVSQGWGRSSQTACLLPFLFCTMRQTNRRHAVIPPLTIAFIALDDRPCNRLFPQQLAAISGTRLLMPPREHLGWYTRPGNCDAIADWLARCHADRFVVSADMLCYGGLVASRTPVVEADLALRDSILCESCAGDDRTA